MVPTAGAGKRSKYYASLTLVSVSSSMTLHTTIRLKRCRRSGRGNRSAIHSEHMASGCALLYGAIHLLELSSFLLHSKMVFSIVLVVSPTFYLATFATLRVNSPTWLELIIRGATVLVVPFYFIGRTLSFCPRTRFDVTSGFALQCLSDSYLVLAHTYDGL